MSHSRRNFLKKTSLAGLGWAVPKLGKSTMQAALVGRNLDPTVLAQDESFWAQIRQQFAISPNLINLNNAGVSPHPRVVGEAVTHYTRQINEAPGYYMWRVLERRRSTTLAKLAALMGCTPTELTLVRNATEALDTVLKGIDFQPGEEILISDQDYPAVLNMVAQLERRHQVVVRRITLPVGNVQPEEFIGAYRAALSPRTRLMIFCHVINLQGQILPVKQLTELAHGNGTEVLVDAAHSVGQLPMQVQEWGCDYLGSSLHKWLCAPYGTGVLYVKKDRAKKLWPLFGPPENQHDHPGKYHHLGTRSVAAELAVSHAIDFHQMIGTAQKRARLLYLRNYWITRAQEIPGFSLVGPTEDDLSTAIGSFRIAGHESRKISGQLINTYNVYNTVMGHPQVRAVRISPNVYTTVRELDAFISGLKAIVG
jgi:selenocysteine lyase/cysteine desulfurase